MSLIKSHAIGILGELRNMATRSRQVWRLIPRRARVFPSALP